jgi:hypothetical protein
VTPLAHAAIVIGIGLAFFVAMGAIVIWLTREDGEGERKPRPGRQHRPGRHRGRRTARAIGRDVLAYLRDDETRREVQR